MGCLFYALGIAAESPERSGVEHSVVRTCSEKPDPQGNAQIFMHFFLINI